ncbi:MAG: LCP family protein [Tissierellia bacterium]|nr:LCP family protein [Tissierellia bacterium]
MKGFFKGFFITLFVLIILSIGAIGFVTVKNHNQPLGDFFEDMSMGEDSMDFLMLGVDSLNVNDGSPSRSDVMMIVHADLKNHAFYMLSVPRDTRTAIPGRKNKEKINHAFAYGGPELSLQTLNQLLGTNIKYYITVDYAFVKEMVETMGGVDVNVPMDMHYEDPTANPPLYIDLKAGEQRLNGDQALQFLRFRKGYANQDLGRVEAQQQFMSAFLKELKSPKSLINFPLYLRSYDKNTQSNIPMSKLAKLSPSILRMGEDSIQTGTLPGVPQTIGGISYFIHDEGATNEILTSRGMK